MRGGLRRVQHYSIGYSALLNSAGVDAEIAAAARREAAKKESETGEAYELVPSRTRWSPRPMYTVRPEGEKEAKPKSGLDHETWIDVVWPKVGGAKWRPNRNQKGGER